jgi:hypothetical protein
MNHSKLLEISVSALYFVDHLWLEGSKRVVRICQLMSLENKGLDLLEAECWATLCLYST